MALTRPVTLLLVIALAVLPSAQGADDICAACKEHQAASDAFDISFWKCIADTANHPALTACNDDKTCVVKVCFPECPGDDFQDMIDCTWENREEFAGTKCDEEAKGIACNCLGDDPLAEEEAHQQHFAKEMGCGACVIARAQRPFGP